jgi:DNA-binding CsgD family transcriptional regulator
VAALRSEEVEVLLEIARDATLGATFQDRIEAVSDALSLLVPTTSMSAFVVDPRTNAEPARAHVLFRNRDARGLVEYATHYRKIDPMGVDFEKGSGAIASLSDFVKPGDFGKEAFTSDYLPQIGCRWLIAFSHLMPDGRLFAYAIQRERGLKDFSSREREILRLASPDIGRAAFGALLSEKFAGLDPGSQGADAVSGAIVFNALGDVLHHDPGAVALTRRLTNSSVFPADVFVAEVRRLAARDDTSGLVLERTFALAQGGWLRVRFSRPASEAPVGGNNILAVLEVLAPGTRAHFDALSDHAGLTPREREVAALAIRGLGNREIAARFGTALPTIGRQLVNIYKKTGVSGRLELAALFSGTRSSQGEPDHPS